MKRMTGGGGRFVGACALAAALSLGSCVGPGHDGQRAGAQDRAAGTLPAGVFEVAPGVYSGPMPEGREGFEALGALGVRTVLSVDGARPDVEDAEACGMDYAHVPTRYSGIADGERDRIARVLLEAPRPIYVHCHHGKHRGPAAAAAGMIAIGEMNNAEGLALLETAGTSPAYPGLWEAVRVATAMEAAEIEAAPLAPPIATVSGFVAGMSTIDHAWDNLKLCREAGWAAPADHPDLVPASEAGIIADAFRQTMGDAEIAGQPEDFHAWMREAQAGATELELLIVAGAERGRLEEAFGVVAKTCKDCHATYRN